MTSNEDYDLTVNNREFSESHVVFIGGSRNFGD